MKSVPFSSILAETCQLVGLDLSTLNEKSFCTIRDFVSRRLGTIWDREEWPDIERWGTVYPGTPASSVVSTDTSITDNAGNLIVDELGNTIVYALGEEMEVTFTLSRQSKAVVLMDFEDNAYRNGTIGSTRLKLTQPLFVQKTDGDVEQLNGEYEFTYTTEALSNGRLAIATVTITVPNGLLLGATDQTGVETAGPISDTVGGNSIVFLKNPQYLVQVSDVRVNGVVGVGVVEAYTSDPRKTTRTSTSRFILEDFQPWEMLDSAVQLNNGTYVRFFDGGVKYIKYRLPYRQFIGKKFDASTLYGTTSQCYYDPYQGAADYLPLNRAKAVGGDFWECDNQLYAGQAPSNSTAVWRKLEIPMRFKNYIVNGVVADFMRSEGRTEDAVPFEQMAEVAVAQQIDVLIRQQGQNQRMNMVFTY